MKTAKLAGMNGLTPNVLKWIVLNEKYQRLNASLEWSQITGNDDPRNALAAEVNDALSLLTPEENGMLDKYIYG